MVSLNGGRPFAESGELKIAEPRNGSLKIFRILLSQFSQAQQVHANPLVHSISLPVPYQPHNSSSRYGVS